MGDNFSTPGVFVVHQFKPLKKVRLALCVLGAGALLLAGCTHMARYVPGKIGALPNGSFRRAWLADLAQGQGLMKSIDVRDKAIYVYGTGKHLTSLNRKDGTINFVSVIPTASDRILAPVELADKLVIPTATSLELFDYKGNPLRSVALAEPLRSGAVGSGNNIYFGADGSNGGLVEAIDLSQQYSTVRWELLTPGTSITATPCLYSSILYIGTESGQIYAVTETRKPVWDTPGNIFQCTGSITAPLVADDAGLYVATKGGILYCINRVTGKLKWQYFAGNRLSTAPVPTSDTVYEVVPTQGLAAVDKTKGGYNRIPRWVFPKATQFLAQDDKYAYLLEEKHGVKKTTRTIIAVDKSTGKLEFQSKHTNFDLFGTNTKDNTIYAGYRRGTLLAIKPVLKPGQIGELVLQPVKPANAMIVASAFR